MNPRAPVWLTGAGLTCALGHQAMPAAAAIDAGVVRLQTSSDPYGSLHRIGVVPGATGQIDGRVDAMLFDAISGCWSLLPARPREHERILVYLGWADERRPGAPRCPTRGELVERLGVTLGLELERDDVHVMRGDTAGLQALAIASARLRHDPGIDECLVCAADSWLDARALAWLGDRRHDMTPGEAGAALWLSRIPAGPLAVQVLGGGVSSLAEPFEGPMARALVSAMQHALEEADITFDDLDLRVSDLGTLPSDYAEHTLAAARLRVRPPLGYRKLEPALQLGSAGATAGMLNVVVASYLLARRRHSLAMCTASSDASARVAVVLGAAPPEPGAQQGGHPPWAL